MNFKFAVHLQVTARLYTYPQFTAILSIGARIKNHVYIRIGTYISFIAKLPLAVIAGCVEDIGISEVQRLIYDILSVGI
jgi:hypothetical protein